MLKFVILFFIQAIPGLLDRINTEQRAMAMDDIARSFSVKGKIEYILKRLGPFLVVEMLIFLVSYFIIDVITNAFVSVADYPDVIEMMLSALIANSVTPRVLPDIGLAH